ncbi:MAG TPA: two-component system response regulator, partial [Elusimicrobia bacterium]|nr:two-component system response regulator [Elusimicrobiota bacterium]
MKTLVVEDNVMTRGMIVDLLAEMGHQVVGQAENGEEAVRIFREQRPELVLLDLIMPGKTGMEVLVEIKAIDPAVKVVMVTAVRQDLMSRQLLEKGALAVL